MRWLESCVSPPPFQVPQSLEAWQTQRALIRAKLWQLSGDLPTRPSTPKVQIVSREDRGDYVVEKFQFDNAAGAIVPGYLLLPKHRQNVPAPAVLYCHCHAGDFSNGKEELFSRKYLPEPAGPALARRGFVVLAIDAYCFGERNGAGPGGADEKDVDGEWTATKFFLWIGRTLWGMMLRDDLIALDYLSARSEVDPQRIGVTGLSMGATRTWWLMALDERLRAGAAVACLTRYQDLVAQHGLKHHGPYYYVPGLLKHLDAESIVALIAPRPILFQNGTVDSGSPIDGIQKIDAAVRPIYRLFQEEENFNNAIYANVGHEYLPEMWRKTLAWLESHLNPQGSS
jgi:dienelactone hydrolase